MASSYTARCEDPLSQDPTRVRVRVRIGVSVRVRARVRVRVDRNPVNWLGEGGERSTHTAREAGPPRREEGWDSGQWAVMLVR